MSQAPEDRTAAERARLLEPLARRALESYDVEVDGLSLITNDWNCVFRVDLRDGSRRVLRVSLPRRRSHVEVEGEMAWLAALAGGPVPVPVPVPARDGSLVVDATATGVPESRVCAVFEWLDGDRLARTITPELIADLGEATARLHAHAASFPAPAGMKTWDSPYPFLEPEVLFDREYKRIVEVAGRDAFQAARARTIEVVARLRIEEAPRMLHADLHEDNAFVQPDGRIAILDFDDSMLGWPVQDLGITVWALASHDGFEGFEHALRDGYERVTAWPERVPGEVRVFAADRCLMLANYIVQDDDPEYRAEAPKYVDEWGAMIERLLG